MTESLKMFGAEESASEAIAVRFTEPSGSEGSFASHLKSALNCIVSEFSTEFCDLQLIKQVYRPTNEDRLVGELCAAIATKNI